MASFKKVNPLDWQTPIVATLTGVPTPQFIRFWQTMLENGEFSDAEIDTKADKTTTITAGAGLTGGGDLSANRTIDVGAGTGITVNANDVALANTAVTPGTYGNSTNVSQITVDQQGRLTAAANVAISLAGLGGVPTTRVLTAGAGLTGGGDLSADRTFDVGAGTGITVNANDIAITSTGVVAATYGSATVVPQIAVNAQGQITSATDVAISAAGIGALVAANNLSDLTNAATARTNLGLVAGGAGDIWVEKAGDTMTGGLTINTGATLNGLNVVSSAAPTGGNGQLVIGDGVALDAAVPASEALVISGQFFGGYLCDIHSTTGAMAARRAQGVKGAPTALSTQNIFGFSGYGYDGTAYGQLAGWAIQSMPSGATLTTSDHGGCVYFNVVPAGTTAAVTSLFVDSARHVGIGLADSGTGVSAGTAARRLHVRERLTGTTTGINYIARFATSSTVGTAATFGSGIEYYLRNGSSTERVAMTHEYRWTDPTNASEDAAFDLKLIKAGTLTTALTIDSLGVVTVVNNVLPSANDGSQLGSGTLSFSDLFLASGGVVNFNNGNATLTHSAGLITSNVGWDFGAAVRPTANDGGALGAATLGWSDLFLASGAVINFNNGNQTITHSADLLTITDQVNVQVLGRGAPVTKTADFTVAATESWLINNKSGSTCVVTLPAAGSYTGREIMIKNIQAQLVNSASSNVVPLAGGAAGTAILPAVAGSWATLVSDGTNWIIMQS